MNNEWIKKNDVLEILKDIDTEGQLPDDYYVKKINRLPLIRRDNQIGCCKDCYNKGSCEIENAIMSHKELVPYKFLNEYEHSCFIPKH